jgi:hypothetical protein
MMGDAAAEVEWGMQPEKSRNNYVPTRRQQTFQMFRTLLIANRGEIARRIAEGAELVRFSDDVP